MESMRATGELYTPTLGLTLTLRKCLLISGYMMVYISACISLSQTSTSMSVCTCNCGPLICFRSSAQYPYQFITPNMLYLLSIPNTRHALPFGIFGLRFTFVRETVKMDDEVHTAILEQAKAAARNTPRPGDPDNPNDLNRSWRQGAVPKSGEEDIEAAVKNRVGGVVDSLSPDFSTPSERLARIKEKLGQKEDSDPSDS